jgi:hypothetical protein
MKNHVASQHCWPIAIAFQKSKSKALAQASGYL